MADLQIQFAHPWVNPDSGTSYAVGQLATFNEELAKRLIYNGYASIPGGTPPPLIPPGVIDDVELGFALTGYERKVSRATANPGYQVVLAENGVDLVLAPAITGGGGNGNVSDATGSVKGVVALAGDLSGTAAAPTVPGLQQKLNLEQVQDAVAEMIVAGTNIVKVYDDATGTLTLSAAGGSGEVGVTDPEVVRDTIAAALVAGSGITIAHNDVANTITITSTVTGGTTDPEVVRDTMAAALVAGSNVTITPNDAGDTITISSTGGGGGGVADAIDGGGPTSTYATPTDQLERIRDTIASALVAGPGMAVLVNDEADTIVLSSSGSTDPEVVRDTMAAALVAGSGVTITPNDAADTITIAATVDQEVVRDTIAAALVAGAGTTIVHNDAANTITISSTGGGGVDAEAVRDIIGATVVGTGSIQVTANDAADLVTVHSTATTNSSDAALLSRSNHTGTQAAATISDLAAVVKAWINAPGSAMNPHTSASAARNPDFTVNFWACWPSTPANAAAADQLLVPADGMAGPTGRYLQQFAGSAGSWTNDGTAATVAYSTDRATSSPGSLKVTSGSNGSAPTRAASPRFAVAHSSSYVVTARIGTAAAAGRSVGLLYRLYNASNTLVDQGIAGSVGSTEVLVGSGFTSMAWTVVVPANAAITQMDLQLSFSGVLAVGEVFYVDDVTVG